MKRLLILSWLLLILMAAAAAYAVNRLGGWQYALYRLQYGDSGMYEHRKTLFERMPDRPGAIVFLGDSQIGLCEWQEMFADLSPVLNRGISGDHVQGVLDRLDEVLRHRPEKVFLEIGVNDLLWGKTPAEIAGPYREIVQKIRQARPDGQLFLLSVLPVNKKQRALSTGNADIQALNGEIARIAKEFALPYVDLYNQLTDASGDLSPQFSSDGLHLNGLGYAMWKKQIKSYLYGS
ncbi:MAG: hypothetical protein KDC61_05120 [Saprospiraceae bacterium]|nr:hypothetical protein [Saprospiraceae bacterium]MCB0544949.1 hypothetical protein [Saprospiraceae bacterium]MCB0573931.1 hypothetical protein [Saprospiraceae bacterium]MCB9304986.1 sialate O-acetylesterase [Lewinellaceae bacterium]MCB9353265.1 sialate O-acetylesterase [Lewinellaceae bacterium]